MVLKLKCINNSMEHSDDWIGHTEQRDKRLFKTMKIPLSDPNYLYIT